MEQLTAFFNMGGYAVFVWTSYGLASSGMLGLWYMYRRAVRSRQATLDRLRPPRDTECVAKEPETERGP